MDGAIDGSQDMLVQGPEEVIENIYAYQNEIEHSPELASNMRKNRWWFAHMLADGSWLIAPAKFAGYRHNDAETHIARGDDRHGGTAEKQILKWYKEAEGRLRDELWQALTRYVARFGHSGPNKSARICVPKDRLDDRAAPSSRLRERIAVNPAICGGRPHIRGTRMPVSDLLALMAADVDTDEVLQDFPYLSRADILAALGYAASLSGHRVVE